MEDGDDGEAVCFGVRDELVLSSCSFSFLVVWKVEGREKKIGKELNEQFGSVR